MGDSSKIFFFPPNKPLQHENIVQLLFINLNNLVAGDMVSVWKDKEVKLKSSGFRYYFRFLSQTALTASDICRITESTPKSLQYRGKDPKFV